MVMAAERVGITPIVRTPGFDPAFILRLLDMGVQGIQVPHISDARAAREAVKAVRYAPLGDRGMAGASRASDYGKIPIREHMERSNDEITLAVMIEDLPALQDIDAIASTDGVDIVAVGPSDMSRALGVSGTADHPKLVEAVHRVPAAIRKGGIARLALPMNHPALPRDAAQLRELGVGYCNCAPAPEVRMLKSMQAQVAEARARLT
jgi:4-hydroxy-2-oxoheptanedioate aldolase